MSHAKPHGDRCTPRTYSLPNAMHKFIEEQSGDNRSAYLRRILAREMARLAKKEGK